MWSLQICNSLVVSSPLNPKHSSKRWGTCFYRSCWEETKHGSYGSATMSCCLNWRVRELSTVWHHNCNRGHVPRRPARTGVEKRAVTKVLELDEIISIFLNSSNIYPLASLFVKYFENMLTPTQCMRCLATTPKPWKWRIIMGKKSGKEEMSWPLQSQAISLQDRNVCLFFTKKPD